MSQFKIKAPWGELDMADGALAQIRHVRNQLTYFLHNNASPNPEFTKAERDGYDVILASKSEANARMFLVFKGECRERGELPPANLEIISQLKASGKWEELT